MVDTHWKTIELFDDNGTTMAYQQMYQYPERGRPNPIDRHRAIPVKKLTK